MQTKVQVLAKAELEKIHQRSLSVLSRTGMRIDTPQGRALLLDAGATQKGGSDIICFPSQMVEQAIALAPKAFCLGGRRAGWQFQVNRGDCTLCLNGEGTMVIDRHNRSIRASLENDWLEATRVADSLDEIGVYWRMVTPSDRGETMADFAEYTCSVFRNFSKHVQDPFISAAQAPWLLEILATIFGGRAAVREHHPYSTLLCPQSPLILQAEYTDAYLALKGWNIPVAVMPMALMGATAPASMIATLIQCNCEVLATLCLIQANEPGTPFLYAPALSLMDPRNGRYFAGGVENAIMATAAIEMARYYGFPVMGTAFSTDGFGPSIQGGYERGINSVLPLMAWPDIMVGPGLYGGDIILSLDQLLIDAEMFRMCRQMKRGMAADESRWLERVIDQVGPGGNYFMADSTLKGVRSDEWYLPQLGVHDSFENWQENDRPSLEKTLPEKLDHILESHQPLAFDPDVEKELQQIMQKAAKVEGHYPLV